MLPILLVLLLFFKHAPDSDSHERIVRRDCFVASGPGIQIFVRELFLNPYDQTGPAILLIHGARVPGVAWFDLPAPGGSLAADLAARGVDVYIMDIRGYGSSTRPKEMDDFPEQHAPLVRSNDAAQDIAVVVDSIHQPRPTVRIVLFGWATSFVLGN